MEEKKQGEKELDLGQIAGVLWSKAVVIVLAGLLCAGLAFLGTKLFIKPTYESTTSIYLVNKQGDNLTASDLNSAEMLTKDCQKIITNRTVLDEAADILQLDGGYSSLLGRISVSVPTNTRIIEITATDQDPNRAKEIVDTIAAVSQEKIKSIMGVEEVNIFEYGDLPGHPSGPRVMQNTALAGVLGIGLAACIIILHFIMDDTIKTADDVTSYLGLTTIGLIPDVGDGGADRGSKKKRKKRG